MAGEVQIAYGVTGKTVYFTVRTSTATIWNGSAFEAYNASNVADYDTAMSEQGASGVYAGTFSGSSEAGSYNVTVRERAGGSPAESDAIIGSGPLHWTGSAVLGAFNAAATTVDVGKISGDATAADNLERMLEGVQTGAVDTATLSASTTVFETDLTEASDDHYNNQAIVWGAGATNAGLTFYITDSEGTTTNSNNKVKLTVQTMPNVPGNGNVFEIIGTKGSG